MANKKHLDILAGEEKSLYFSIFSGTSPSPSFLNTELHIFLLP